MAQSVEHSLFLRSNTAEGCVSYLNSLCRPGEGWRIVLVKNGQGGAVGALLRQTALLAESRGLEAELFWDAPGQERPYALRLPSEKLCLLCADAPYALEPRLPGVDGELLSLDRCRDNAALREHGEELRHWNDTWQRELRRAERFMRAARAIKRDMSFVAGETVDHAKIERFASRFATLRIPPPSGHIGLERRRFLTAATGQGLLLRRSGLNAAGGKAVVLEDDYGVSSPFLWSLIRAYALGCGADLISCPCLLDPSGPPEHLLLPGLNLACVTANRRHPIEFEGAQRILATRFLQKDALREHRCRLSFCRRTLRELLAEAYQAQNAAEQARAALDGIYAAAIRPDEIERAARALLP
ncbi:MAG: hypothetical protein FWH26_01435 [Oscillospiraceae bacterium]|nr:hypothetical protein [Oscillospiraceae bacterium]